MVSSVNNEEQEPPRSNTVLLKETKFSSPTSCLATFLPFMVCNQSVQDRLEASALPDWGVAPEDDEDEEVVDQLIVAMSPVVRLTAKHRIPLGWSAKLKTKKRQM